MSAGGETTDAVRLAQPVCLDNEPTRRFPKVYCSHYDLITAATLYNKLRSACRTRNFDQILSANIKLIVIFPMSMTKSEEDNSADYLRSHM